MKREFASEFRIEATSSILVSKRIPCLHNHPIAYGLLRQVVRDALSFWLRHCSPKPGGSRLHILEKLPRGPKHTVHLSIRFWNDRTNLGECVVERDTVK